jgi:hypothetical protein
MIVRIFILAPLVILLSCKGGNDNQNQSKKYNSKDLIIGCWRKYNDTVATERITKDSLINFAAIEFFPPIKYEIKNDTMITGYGIEKGIIVFLDSNTFVTSYTDTLIKPNITYHDTLYRTVKCK